MTDRDTSILAVETVTAEGCTLEELCQWCNADADWILEIISYGVIEPTGPSRSQWRFTSKSIARVAKAKRLQRDLELNMPGVAVVLELLDEIERLRRGPSQ